MNYKDVIRVNEKFQNSINLEFDLNNLDKIEGYIPVDQSVRILKEYLKNVYSSATVKSTILVGPYGRGKSHLILVMLAIVSNCGARWGTPEIKRVLAELVAKIDYVDKEAGAVAREIVQQEKPMLPVLINNNNGNLQQSLLLALRKALERANLDGVLPFTYFDVAIETINRWMNDFPAAYEQLSTKLKEHNLTAETMMKQLTKYNVSVYQLFCTIYPQVVMGAEFNPLFQSDVVALYKEVNHILCDEHGYRGIYVVFDEFSKFLEANTDKSQMDQYKILQDFCEQCNRSGDEQIHFTCITHKNILEYSRSDSFRTVEARFKYVYFTASSEQSYQLIANAINKNEKFDDFYLKHSNEFLYVKKRCAAANLFHAVSDEFWDETLLKGCFPLAPTTAYVLLRVSEKVAQNERTMFTFLSSKEEYTVSTFIETHNNSFDIITADLVYDFFNDLFRKEVFNVQVHSAWSRANSALREVKSEEEVKVVKALAVINIINDGQLKPIHAHLKALTLLSDIQFDSAIEELLKKKVIAQRTSTSFFAFLTANGIDIKRNIVNYVNENINNINRSEVLTELQRENYIFPRQYNDRYHMLRYFRYSFVEAASFVLLGIDASNSYFADGYVHKLLWETDKERDAAIEKIREYKSAPEVILSVPNKPFTLTPYLKEYYAAKSLKNSEEAKTDAQYYEELEIYEEDIEKFIISYLTEAYEPSINGCQFYNCDGQIKEINKSIHLNRKISAICESTYSRTAIINNEMVNRRKLTPPVRKARNEVVRAVLAARENEIVEITGNGPEATLFRALISNKGINITNHSDDDALNEIFRAISSFILNCEIEKKAMSVLTGILTSKPYGLRESLIPVYVACVLRFYVDGAVFYLDSKEIDISPESIEKAVLYPEKYYLKIDIRTSEKSHYLINLRSLFSNCGDEVFNMEQSINARLVVESMQRWIRSLPRCSRETERIRQDETINSFVALKFRKLLLRYDINPRELLFESFPDTFSEAKDLSETEKNITTLKTIIDEYSDKLKEYLILEVKAAIYPTYEGSMTQALKLWYSVLDERTKKHLYDDDTNHLLRCISKISSDDEYAVLNQIVVTMMNTTIEDFNDFATSQFIESIKKSTGIVNEFNTKKSKLQNAESESCFITIAAGDIVIERELSKGDISPIGYNILNEIDSMFDDYGGAINTSEQIAILLEKLKILLKK